SNAPPKPGVPVIAPATRSTAASRTSRSAPTPPPSTGSPKPSAPPTKAPPYFPTKTPAASLPRGRTCPSNEHPAWVQSLAAVVQEGRGQVPPADELRGILLDRSRKPDQARVSRRSRLGHGRRLARARGHRCQHSRPARRATARRPLSAAHF